MSGHNIQYNESMAPLRIPDPGASGAIPTMYSGICELVSADAETRTLGAPSFLGQRLTLCFKTDGGDCVVTCATGLNAATGSTVITFDTAGEMIELVACSSGSDLRWRGLACIPEADTASLS